MSKMATFLIFLIFGMTVMGCAGSSTDHVDELITTPRLNLDQRLRALIDTQGIRRLDPGPEPDAELAALGRVLFFDKILSGNRDISCATCHHPSFPGEMPCLSPLAQGETAWAMVESWARIEFLSLGILRKSSTEGQRSGGACFGIVA